MLGVETGVVVEHVDFDEDAGEVVVAVRLRKSAGRRRGHCERNCGRYDNGEADAVGGRWTLARSGRSSLLSHSE